MRIDSRKKVREVSGEHLVIMQAGDAADMTHVVALNESALMLHGQLSGRDFEVGDVVHALTEAYDVDEATALRDADEWVRSMIEQGLIVNN